MMAEMADHNPHNKNSLGLRLLRRLLAGERGEIRALQDAIRLQRMMHFTGLLAATILLPSVLLAYFGISSIQGEELAKVQEVHRLAEGASDAMWAQAERPFLDFEKAVKSRLQAGLSPLDPSSELHPHLVVALKLNDQQELEEPFLRGGRSAAEPVEFLFSHQANAAATLERQKSEPQAIARMYGRAARSARTRQAQARLSFDKARMLSSAGRTAEASAVMTELVRKHGQVRDPWGYRLTDLVSLHRAETLQVRNKAAGNKALRSLVEDLLSSHWTVGQGGEPAVARRALSRLEEKEWVAAARGRIDARARMLYWTERLLPELDTILGGRSFLRIDQGKVRWSTGEQGLWGITWWGDGLYAFSLDQTEVIGALRLAAKRITRADSPVVCVLVPPGEDGPPEPLTQRNLAPWLQGWSIVVAPRDPAALVEDLNQHRSRRIGIVLLAVLMIVVGAMATARLVGNELQNARMKADFAANVSHELRSPITQIRLKAESLMYGLSETPEEQQHDYKTIVRESERLSRLVDNVLDFSAIERGAKRYSLVPGDLIESVRTALDVVSASVELQSRSLEIDLSARLPPVDHDPDAVAQCVINLVSNAAKYSSPGQPISIVARRRRGGAEIIVRDHGIGIPAEDLRQIFDAFYRGADKSVRQRKGTGIGLAITQYIMQAHEGRVEVVSIPGEGSTFSLWFPAAASASSTTQR
jgi:signal transduction histidine kinase